MKEIKAYVIIKNPERDCGVSVMFCVLSIQGKKLGWKPLGEFTFFMRDNIKTYSRIEYFVQNQKGRLMYPLILMSNKITFFKGKSRRDRFPFSWDSYFKSLNL